MKKEAFEKLLEGKHIPILTLDHKWHQLFTQTSVSGAIRALENELNGLLARQGKLTTETKEILKIKKKLMQEIMGLMEKLDTVQSDKRTAKKLKDNGRLINECNEKLGAYEEELLEIPREIARVNRELMLATMEVCYAKMKVNEEQIKALDAWIADVRIRLNQNVLKKQEMEENEYELYSYMHDIFGAEMMEVFDLNADKQSPTSS